MVSPSVFPTEFSSKSLLESSLPSPNSSPLLRPAQGLESSRPKFFRTPLSSSRPPALAPGPFPPFRVAPHAHLQRVSPPPAFVQPDTRRWSATQARAHAPSAPATVAVWADARSAARRSRRLLPALRIPAARPPAKARRVRSGFAWSLCPRGALACSAAPIPARSAEPHRPRAPFHPPRARLHEPTSSLDPLSSRLARDSLPPQDGSSPGRREEPSFPSCPGTHRRSAGKHRLLRGG